MNRRFDGELAAVVSREMDHNWGKLGVSRGADHQWTRGERKDSVLLEKESVKVGFCGAEDPVRRIELRSVT